MTTVVATAMASMAITTAVPTVMFIEVPGAPTGRTGRRRGSSGKGRFRNDLGLIGDHGLPESDHGACLAKGWEWGHVGDVVGGDGDLGLRPRMRVGEGLDTLAVVGDGGVPLNKSMKLIAKVDCTRLPVVIGEVRDHGVEGACGLIVVVHGEGEDRVIDRGVEPAFDGVVGLFPHRIGGMHSNSRVEEGEEPKLPDHGLEEGVPAGEVWPVELEGDRHVGLGVDHAEWIDDGWCDVRDESVRRGRAGEGRRRRICTARGHGGGGARVVQWKRWRLGLGSVERKKA
jgi:hypothetical protein